VDIGFRLYYTHLSPSPPPSVTQAYFILDELLIGGNLQETSKRLIIRHISQQDSLAETPEESKTEIRL
jgi:hypothetical protein